MKIIQPAAGVAMRLTKGQTLTVYDVEGQQVSDLYCVSAEDTREVLSCGRSMDYADTIYLSKGDFLYSNRSRRLLEIVNDTCGIHDLLMPPCSLRMFQIVAGDENLKHPSCHENLSLNLQPFGVSADSIQNSFNIFMNVRMAENGNVRIETPTSKSMDSISFRCEVDLIVSLTACSHEGTNGGRLKPIGYSVE